MNLRLTQAAARFLLEKSDSYRRAGDPDTAMLWEVAVDEIFYALLHWPKRGLPCGFEAGDLTGLRWTAMPRFANHIVFHRYLPEQDTVVLVHVLSGIRHLATVLSVER